MSTTADRESTSRLDALIQNIERVVVGKRDEVRLSVVALLAQGHLLIEDAPGTGKTTLARALARSVQVSFGRIQFTSDLLPSDLLGVSVFDSQEGRFSFQPGPIFTNVVLADELNRTSPRTQSALLECMDERRVTIDGRTHELPSPFLVVATQNPIEFEGTYPLPESQLDRFLMKIELGYPARAEERSILNDRMTADPLDTLEPVMTRAELEQEIEAVTHVKVDEALIDYALDVVQATRDSARFLIGASPRASLGWVRAARALARVEGRDFCTPDDLKRLARPVLAHRLVEASSLGVQSALSEVLESVSVPD